MVEFVHRHEIVLMFILCACVGWITWHYERWRDRKAFIESTHHVWQCVQFGGGATVNTPGMMDKAQACEWASKLGSVAYVDETHNKIFYRAKSG